MAFLQFFSKPYVDKKRAAGLLQGAGVQFPGGLFPTNGYVHSIRDSGSAVNIIILEFRSITKRTGFLSREKPIQREKACYFPKIVKKRHHNKAQMP